MLMWLGELVTEQGIGNGISMIILCGIVANFPKTFASLTASLFDTSNGELSLFGWFNLPVNPTIFYIMIGLGVGLIVVLYLLVKINEAQRIVTINYAKRVHGNSAYGGIKSILPIKLITAGVVPVIFAVAVLSLPQFVGQFMQHSDPNSEVAKNLIAWFTAPSADTYNSATGLQFENFIYPAAYFILVVAFTYFYTSIVINPDEFAENIQNQGGFIEGVRPGEETSKFFKRTVSHLNLFGALALGLIAMLPYIVDYIFILTLGYPLGISVSGTGLLIVVTVAIDNLRQINSRALMVTYDDYK